MLSLTTLWNVIYTQLTIDSILSKENSFFCCVPGISSLTQKGILESIFILGILKSISVRIARPINYHQTYHMHLSIGLEWYDLPKEKNYRHINSRKSFSDSIIQMFNTKTPFTMLTFRWRCSKNLIESY